jgi:hypothetical protein
MSFDCNGNFGFCGVDEEVTIEIRRLIEEADQILADVREVLKDA